MRKDILALAIVKKGGGGGQLDDGLYNVENGNAENLKTKVCASDSSGEMIAQGRYADDDPDAETGSILYYKNGATMDNTYLEGIIDYNADYVWGNKTIGLVHGSLTTGAWYEAEFVTEGNDKHILKPISKPSGTININSNGTHDVTNYAQAVVRGIPTKDIKNISVKKETSEDVSDYKIVGLDPVSFQSWTEEQSKPNFFLSYYHSLAIDEQRNWRFPTRPCGDVFLADSQSSVNRLVLDTESNEIIIGYVNMNNSDSSSDWSITYSSIFYAQDAEDNGRAIIPLNIYNDWYKAKAVINPSRLSNAIAEIRVENEPSSSVSDESIVDFFRESVSIDFLTEAYFMTLSGGFVYYSTGSATSDAVLNISYIQVFHTGSGSGSGSGSGY